MFSFLRGLFSPKPEQVWWCKHRSALECHSTNMERAGVNRGAVIGVALSTQWPTCVDRMQELVLIGRGECTPLCDDTHTFDSWLCELARYDS